MYQVRLAPMCGVTDHVFRGICAEMGCAQGYTEMISAMGYLCAPGQRAVQDLMIRGPQEKKLVLQLFGSRMSFPRRPRVWRRWGALTELI